MPFYNKEHQVGLEAERQVLPLIREYFDRDISKIKGRFSKHDFECPDYTYEVKHRRVKKNSFPDTLIGGNKLQNLTKPLILLFDFTDCLCYIEYDPMKFESYKKQLFGRLDRDADEATIHIYIPIEDLTTILEYH